MKKIALLFWLSCTAWAAPARQRQVLRCVDSVLSEEYRTNGFSGNVLIAEQGTIVYRKSFGMADAAAGRPLQDGSIFRIASVTKTVTAVAVLQLVEQGRLQLEDTLGRFFPDCPYRGVTVRQLLSHTSGLDDFYNPKVWNSSLDSGVTNEALQHLFFAAGLPLRAGPGTDFFYSNMNFLLLARIVGVVSGQPYPQYVSRHIFGPAGMRRSFVTPATIPAALSAEVVTLYDYPGFLAAAAPVAAIPFDSQFHARQRLLCGHNGVYTTAGDLYAFDRALRRGALLRPESQQALYTPVLLPGGKSYSASGPAYNTQYGLGWILTADTSMGKIVFHDGGNPGLKTEFYRNLSRDQCVIILCNREYLTGTLARSLLNVLNGRPVQLRKRSLARAAGGAYAAGGADSALRVLHRLQSDSVYLARNEEVNALGYELLGKGDSRTAMAILTLNAERFPDDANTWDSLGEACYAAGDLAAARVYYEKSVALNPANAGGQEMLRKIKAAQGR